MGWIVGIALGVFAVSFWLASSAAAAALILVQVRQSWPIKVAALLLLVLGFVFGGQAAGSRSSAACDLRLPLSAKVISIERVEEKRIVYQAAAPDGCRLLISADRFPAYQEADHLNVASGNIQFISDVAKQNPGYAGYLARRGLAAVISFPTLSLASDGARPGLSAIPRHLVGQVGKIFPEPDASFVTAILFAQQGTLPKSVITQFQHTGVSHLLAISGQNISLLAGVLYAGAMLFPVRPWARTAFVAVILWAYIISIGSPVSAVRAAFFWTMVLLAFRLRLLVSLPTVIILTTALMVTVNPLVLRDIGFQLSVGAVIGIAAALFLFPLKSPIPSDLIKSSVLITLGATAVTWPIVAASFGNFSLSSPLANLLVLPAASLLQMIALPTLLISFIWLPAALAGSYLVHLAWLWMDWVTRLLTAVPYAFFQNIILPNWLIALYYAALIFACLVVLQRQRRSWRELWA